MSLHIDKPDTMQNEIVRIWADGLKPNRVYKFVMRVDHDYGTHRSFAVFKADGAGLIDLETAKPIRGSYHEIDAMGLFLSMAPCDNFAFGGYLRCTPPVPFYYELELFDENDTKLDKIIIKKHWMHPKLERTEIDEDGFCATLFKPPGDGPFPCVLDISGTGGGLHEHKGAMLASEGFVVICVAFFQYKHLPHHIQDVDINYFKKPIDWLLSKPYTNNILGIQGVSFGATIVDIIATRFHEVKAVVSINGPQCICDYVHIKENGKSMPMVICDDSDPIFLNVILTTRRNFHKMTAELTPQTETAWWRIPKDTEFRVIGSVDDLCQSSCHATLYRQRRLKEFGNKVEIELVNGGHIMEPPYFPHHEIVYAKYQGFYCGYGGEVLLHAKSQERTWANTIKFFERTLGHPPKMPDWDRLTKIEKPRKNELKSQL